MRAWEFHRPAGVAVLVDFTFRFGSPLSDAVPLRISGDSVYVMSPHSQAVIFEMCKCPFIVQLPSKPTRPLACLEFDFVDDTPRDSILPHPLPYKLVPTPARQPLPVYIPIQNTHQRD